MATPLEQTAASGRARELLDQLTTLREQNKIFTIKVSCAKQRKTFIWPVDLGTVTVDALKLAILKIFQFPTKPVDLTLRFRKGEEKNGERFGLENDATFRQYLKSCTLQGFLSLKVQIDTMQKPFSDWKLRKVCELLGLPPSIDEFPAFDC